MASSDARSKLAGAVAVPVEGKIFASDDFTYYTEVETLRKAQEGDHPWKLPEGLQSVASAVEWPGYEGRIVVVNRSNFTVDPQNWPNTAPWALGRGVLVRCYNGGWCSITLRRDKKLKSVKQIEQFECSTKVSIRDAPMPPQKDDGGRSPYVVKIESICRKMVDLAVAGTVPRPGLIVVAGSTGCGKSFFVEQLIKCLMAKIPSKEGRFPHLLTLEDPVEKLLFDSPLLDADGANVDDCGRETGRGGGLFYTPRSLVRYGQNHGTLTETPFQKGDCPGLDEGLRNALRQTPDLLFVGEMRRIEDWPALLHFAGSGHQAITTMHAGSLVEAFENIFRASGARSPAEWGGVAARLLAVVHLQMEVISSAEVARMVSKTGNLMPSPVPSLNLHLPTIWLNTPRSVAGLVADGLASVQPTRPRQDKWEEAHCYWSAWVAAGAMDPRLPDKLGITAEAPRQQGSLMDQIRMEAEKRALKQSLLRI